MRSYDSWQTTIQDDSLGVNVTVGSGSCNGRTGTKAGEAGVK
ncbi:MAG: hypothetical protein PUA59_07630 [Clostridium sp.]|nr:hypothetical protein [Clostridium sp.]